jgi:arylsulfatase A-like enzyme
MFPELALNLQARNLLALGLLAQSPEPKVLLVFIDGFLPDAIAATETPALDRLLAHAAVSLRARAESTTISGSGWSSFVNGVHWDKHGVPDNEFKAPHFDEYPHVLQRLKEARPDAFTASAQSWKPIEDGLVIPAAPDRRSFHDYYAYSDDYWDEASCDAMCTDDMVRFLGDELLDAAVIMYGELDGVAHSDGNKNYHAGSEPYRRMLRRVDGHIGRLLDAIESRTTYPSEDWLVIVSADHAGAEGEGHGKNTPEHRGIPFIVSGTAAHPGEIWPPTSAHRSGMPTGSTCRSRAGRTQAG